jgi:hypothetical protein
MVAECTDVHAKAGEFKMFGFAVLDRGFYSIMIPGDDVVKTSCLIHVTQRDASEKKLEEELKNSLTTNGTGVLGKWMQKSIQLSSLTRSHLRHSPKSLKY